MPLEKGQSRPLSGRHVHGGDSSRTAVGGEFNQYQSEVLILRLIDDGVGSVVRRRVCMVTEAKGSPSMAGRGERSYGLRGSHLRGCLERRKALSNFSRHRHVCRTGKGPHRCKPPKQAYVEEGRAELWCCGEGGAEGLCLMLFPVWIFMVFLTTNPCDGTCKSSLSRPQLGCRMSLVLTATALVCSSTNLLWRSVLVA